MCQTRRKAVQRYIPRLSVIVTEKKYKIKNRIPQILYSYTSSKQKNPQAVRPHTLSKQTTSSLYTLKTKPTGVNPECKIKTKHQREYVLIVHLSINDTLMSFISYLKVKKNIQVLQVLLTLHIEEIDQSYIVCTSNLSYIYTV